MKTTQVFFLFLVAFLASCFTIEVHNDLPSVDAVSVSIGEDRFDYGVDIRTAESGLDTKAESDSRNALDDLGTDQRAVDAHEDQLEVSTDLGFPETSRIGGCQLIEPITCARGWSRAWCDAPFENAQPFKDANGFDTCWAINNTQFGIDLCCR
jgi:hypothetical protein